MKTHTSGSGHMGSFRRSISAWRATSTSNCWTTFMVRPMEFVEEISKLKTDFLSLFFASLLSYQLLIQKHISK